MLLNISKTETLFILAFPLIEDLLSFIISMQKGINILSLLNFVISFVKGAFNPIQCGLS